MEPDQESIKEILALIEDKKENALAITEDLELQLGKEKKSQEAKGLCNNYLEGGDWKMGEICLKTRQYPPLIKQKLISTPPSHNDNIKATSPPLLEKSLLPLIPSYLVYFLDFFLWYKHHFKCLFDVCRRVI